MAFPFQGGQRVWRLWVPPGTEEENDGIWIILVEILSVVGTTQIQRYLKDIFEPLIDLSPTLPLTDNSLADFLDVYDALILLAKKSAEESNLVLDDVLHRDVEHRVANLFRTKIPVACRHSFSAMET
eukprot:GHVO01037199.1.p2 GENE.GHVO01037199.1~~GHVO01037199.1.p2  ORF type:complete len:127 (+),score=9.45 GHVO01037199.1:291-671(+)